MDERKGACEQFVSRVGWKLPIIIDSMENKCVNVLGGWPTRFYLLRGDKFLFISETEHAHFSLLPLIDELHKVL